MVCRGDPRTSRGYRDCRWLEDASNSWRAGHGGRCIRSGFLGDLRPLREARPPEVGRAIPCAARSELGAAAVAHARTVETIRHTLRARGRVHRAHGEDV